MSKPPSRSKSQRRLRGVAVGVLAMLAAPHLQAQSAGQRTNQIESIEGRDRASGASYIRIAGSETPRYSLYTRDNPSRLIVDVAGARLSPDADPSERGGVARFDVGTRAVAQVGAREEGGDAGRHVRVAIPLARVADYEVNARDDNIYVRLTPRHTGEDVGGSNVPAGGSNEAAGGADDSDDAGAADAADQEADNSASVRVRDVDFADTGEHARVIVALSAPAEAEIIEATQRRVVVAIAGVSMPEELERTLDTSEFQGPVRAVSSYRDPDDPERVLVVAQLDRASRAEIEEVGTDLYLDFPKRGGSASAGDGESSDEEPAVLSHDELGDDAPPQGEGDADVEIDGTDFPPQRMGGYGAITASRSSPIQGCNYRPRTIDLDFRDVDIHSLMRMIADVGDVNIVVPDEVDASVTVRLSRIDWVQAMEVILASKGLWYRCEDSLIRVATRAELDAEDEAEAERLRAMAQTESPEPEVFTLNYADANLARDQLSALLSPDGRLEVDERTNSLIINDISAHRRRIIDLLRRLDTQTPQIQIEARVVEARSTYARELGVQWGGSFVASEETGNDTGLQFPNSIAAAGGADDGETPTAGVGAVPSDFAVNLPAAVGTGAGGAMGLSLGSVDGNFNVNLRLSALEEEGTVRLVSAPKVTVKNNSEAEISDGVSVPISVIGAQGVQTQFVDADLSLRVRPNVSQRDCAISMDVNVSNNQPDFANTGARGDPTILRNEAQTSVLVEDGETTVIGGIYTRNTSTDYSKVPFFGDLPVIGWFFKSRRESDEQSEALIFLTPKITNRDVLQCE